MRRRVAKRTDSNQVEIVQALRCAGAFVQSLHIVGKGCPDLLISFRGKIYVMEIKTACGKLNKAEWDWQASWQGDYHIVRNVEDAIRIITEG
jgi:hypothetical protein